VVIGAILSLLLSRIAIKRIGAIDLEHLFGVTGYETHDNNHSDKVMYCLVKANVAIQVGQTWGMVLRRKRLRSLGRVDDGMLRDVEFRDLLDVFRNGSCADVLIQFFYSTHGVPENIGADSRFIACRISFALLLGTVQDGQTMHPVSCLGRTAIMARLEALEQISDHTRFYWTGVRLSDLNGLVAEGKNPDEIVRFFHITGEEVQNGWKILIARVRRVA
jgi:hypothetical protein